MALTNVSKPTTTLANTNKPTTVLANATKISFDPIWSVTVFPWLLTELWTLNSSGITNTTKVT